MDRSIAEDMVLRYHEAIKVYQDGSYHVADNKKSKVPPYLHRRSNHVCTVWQHLVLLALRQYESKSYRRFADFLEESYGVLEYLGLSRIPHYTTLQKAAARLHNGILQEMLESFVLYCKICTLHVVVDATGFGYGQASYYYTKRYKIRRKFLKVAVCADTTRQIVCGIKIRYKRCNDMVDFVLLVRHASMVLPVRSVVADRGYDSEWNHASAEDLGVTSASSGQGTRACRCGRQAGTTER